MDIQYSSWFCDIKKKKKKEWFIDTKKIAIQKKKK